MARDFLGFIGTRRRYGDLSKHRVLHERAIDIFDPELARQLLIDHHDAMIRYERGTEVFSQSSGQSVLVTEGATWQRQRRMLHAAFTPRAVSGYAGLMVDATRQTLDRIHPGFGAEQVDEAGGEEINVGGAGAAGVVALHRSSVPRCIPEQR